MLRGNGLPITLREAALRNLVRVADILPPPTYLLAGIVMSCDRYGRRLGDMVAGTLVVREPFVLETGTPVVTDWRGTWLTRLERGQSGHLTLPHGTLSAVQLGLIDQFIQRQHMLSPTRRRELAQQLLEPLRPILDAQWQSAEKSPEDILCHLLNVARDATVTAASSLSTLDDIAAKQRHWRQFLHQAQRLLRGGRRALQVLTPTELSDFITGYHRVAADLAPGHSLGVDAQTLAELNRLVVLGHNVLYGYMPRRSVGSLRRWFSSFPRLVRQHHWTVWLAACTLFVPACISYMALQWHPTLAYDLVAEEFFAFTPTDQEHLHHISGLFQPIVASTIVTNNMQVSLLAFGLGLTAGIGTFCVLMVNGIHLGALVSWLTLQGHSRALWGRMMPHGGTELLAIILSGAAGLMLAQAIVTPGEVRRATALKQIAPQALQIELGCLMMLGVAGMLEGFISPSGIGYPLRLVILVISLCRWMVYLLWAGRQGWRARSRR